MNKLVLVNKENKMDDKYLDNIELVLVENVNNEKIFIEKDTYDAYIKLRDFLYDRNIIVGISSAYRSFEHQQRVYDDFVLRYGKDYADRVVAPVGCSEHHTGLAIDIDIMVDGKFLENNNDLMKHEDIYLEIHKYISNFGFILRYMKGKEIITGYPYEPWHLRYVGDKASYISKHSLTLEEYISSQ